MSFVAQASAMRHAEIVELLKIHAVLKQSHDELKCAHDELARQVEWFKRRLFRLEVGASELR